MVQGRTNWLLVCFWPQDPLKKGHININPTSPVQKYLRVTSFDVVEGPLGVWGALKDLNVTGLASGKVLVVTVEHGVSMASEGGERQQRQNREV